MNHDDAVEMEVRCMRVLRHGRVVHVQNTATQCTLVLHDEGGKLPTVSPLWAQRVLLQPQRNGCVPTTLREAQGDGALQHMRVLRVSAARMLEPGHVHTRHLLEALPYEDRAALRSHWRAQHVAKAGTPACRDQCHTLRALLALLRAARCSPEALRCARDTLQECYAPQFPVRAALALRARPASCWALPEFPGAALHEALAAASQEPPLRAEQLWWYHALCSLQPEDEALANDPAYAARRAIFRVAQSLRLLEPLPASDVAARAHVSELMQHMYGAHVRAASRARLRAAYSYAGSYTAEVYGSVRAAALRERDTGDVLLVTPTTAAALRAAHYTRLPACALDDVVEGRAWLRGTGTLLVLLHAHCYGVCSVGRVAALGHELVMVGDVCASMSREGDPAPPFGAWARMLGARPLHNGTTIGPLGPVSAMAHAALRAPALARNAMPPATVACPVRRLSEVPAAARMNAPLLVAGARSMHAAAQTLRAAALDAALLPAADAFLLLPADTGQLLRVMSRLALTHLPTATDATPQLSANFVATNHGVAAAHSGIGHVAVQPLHTEDDGSDNDTTILHRHCCGVAHDRELVSLAAHPDAWLCNAASPTVLARAACGAPLFDEAVLYVHGTAERPCRSNASDLRDALSLVRRTLYIVVRQADYLPRHVLARSGFARPAATLQCNADDDAAAAPPLDNTDEPEGAAPEGGTDSSAAHVLGLLLTRAAGTRLACVGELCAAATNNTAAATAAAAPDAAPPPPAFEYPTQAEIAEVREDEVRDAMREYARCLCGERDPAPALGRTLYCVCVLLCCNVVRGHGAELERWYVDADARRFAHGSAAHRARLRDVLNTLDPFDDDSVDRAVPPPPGRAAAAVGDDGEPPLDDDDDAADRGDLAVFTRMLAMAVQARRRFEQAMTI